MVKPYIYDPYLALVPRHSKQSRENLKQSIKDKGLQVDIEVSNQSGRIVDGMTRYEICDELKIKKTYKMKDFASDADEMQYVITANLKRRQLTLFQQIELSQTLRKQFMVENRALTNKQISEIKLGKSHISLIENTRTKMAHLVECGTAVIDQANYIIDHSTNEELQQIRQNKIAINPLYIKIVNRRRKTPGVLTRNDRVFPDCAKCGGATRFRGKCHVHDKYCCRNCDWGI